MAALRAHTTQASGRVPGGSLVGLCVGIAVGRTLVELAVYFCCLEAIQNAAKHAGRDARVTVRLSCEEDELSFSVEDDGCGFDAASAKGSGLAGIEARIVPLGSRLEVSSTLGYGPTVAGALPWLPRTENSAPAQPAVV